MGEKDVPLYSTKFSRKDYTLHKHIVLLVLRSRERKTYRDFVEWLEVCDCIKQALGLNKVPHYTALQKVADRLPPGLLEEILAYVGHLVAGDECVVGIDGTGFSLQHSSKYYCHRIKRLDKHSNYLKATITGDMETQAILSTRLRLKRRHDSVDFKPVLRKTRKLVNMSTVVADKGYDSEENLEFTESELHARAVISLKNRDKPLEKTKGKLRRELKQDFPLDVYHQRNKIETIISVVKRKYGDTIQSRKHRTKKNECYLKLIAYNCQKAINKLETLLQRVSTKLSFQIMSSCPMSSLMSICQMSTYI